MATSSPQTPDPTPRPLASAGHSLHDAPSAGRDGRPGRKWPAPPERDRLLRLTHVSAGLYTLAILGGLVLYALNDLAAAYEQVGWSSEEARLAAAGGGLIAVLVLAAVLGLYRVVYKGLKRGKKWARRLGIVCAVVSILGTGLGLFQPLIYGGWEVLHILIRVAGIVVDALWLITVFRKPIPHWFALPF
ncbi:hypothetical protein ACFYE2_16870 [Kocuria sp. CPCC 205300]|uniref:hypothetical protein n=1 Tax=Kocuria sabuli TaxID=3071448 RepID=UPI0036DC35D6